MFRLKSQFTIICLQLKSHLEPLPELEFLFRPRLGPEQGGDRLRVQVLSHLGQQCRHERGESVSASRLGGGELVCLPCSLNLMFANE